MTSAAEPGRTPLDREAARVLLLDGSDRLLLFRGCDPADRDRGQWWFTPGGGLDPGETYEQGARREVLEETGLSQFDLGPPVWHRTAQFMYDGQEYRQHEVFFLARVHRHKVDTGGFSELEQRALHGHRWWPLAELLTTGETVYPSTLPTELARVLRDGPPAEPYEVGA